MSAPSMEVLPLRRKMMIKHLPFGAGTMLMSLFFAMVNVDVVVVERREICIIDGFRFLGHAGLWQRKYYSALIVHRLVAF